MSSAVASGSTGADYLVDLAQVNVVAQELTSPALEGAGSTGTTAAIDDVVTQFTGQALEDAIVAAENDVGDVDGGIDGTNSSELLTGTINGEANSGLGGDDTIEGDAGADVLVGGIGNDQLFGNTGNDALLGGFGDDTLDGGLGNDNLQGGFGNDQITDGAGNDLIDGGDGDDYINHNAYVTAVFEDQFTLVESLNGGDDNDNITFNVSLNHETFYNGPGAEPPIGGIDYTFDLLGGAGNDTISGYFDGYGNVSTVMTVDGGDGNDLLELQDVGVYGDDEITLNVLGGAGEDRIVLRLQDKEQTSHTGRGCRCAGAARGARRP